MIDAMGISVVELLPLALLFVAVLALLAVSFGVANIVRPLQELDRRARQVAWGDFDAVKEPVGGVQEVDELRATLAQMADRIRSYQSGMRDYLSAVTQAQEAERERLAHDLHDDTVQALIALRQRAQMARKSLGGGAPDPERARTRLDELTGLIDDELTNLRRLIGDLRPIYLEDLGFVPALDMLARQTEARCGLRVRLDAQGQTVRLAPDLELAAYRIVQQALANAAGHAQADEAVVTVAFDETELRLEVRDDGRGFIPPDQPADLARDGHFGLMGMRERALLYGGKLTIRSAPGQGTTIGATLPLVTGGSHAER
jgi:signal transduction histidine kinase